MDNGTYDEHQNYCESVCEEQTELLANLHRATYLRCIHPRMISGSLLGRTLSLLSKMLRPQRILEIGTFTGYSALCLAEGLAENGELVTIESDDELIGIQEEFFAKSAYKHVISTVHGKALEVLPKLTGKFQLIFLDADKENYIHYLDMMLELSESGTVILIDNMLWEGKVLDSSNVDPQTLSILALTQAIKKDTRLEQVLLPVRDGLMVVRVK